MISFSFKIKNPWAKDRDEQHDFFSWEPRISKNWAIETQLSLLGPYNLFVFSIDTAWRGEDHAGPGIEIEVLGLFFIARFYNVNHWDYDNGCWEKYPEQGK